MNQLTIVESPSREDASNRASDSQQAEPQGAPANDGAKVVEELHPLQLQAAALLAGGKTVTAVATELSVDRSTIHRWKQQPAFLEEFHQRTQDMQDHFNSRLLSVASTATDILEVLLTGGYAETTAVAAANVALKHALKNKV
jgi:hypothetical protein